MRAALLVVVAGCGRLGFTPLPDDATLFSGDGRRGDGSTTDAIDAPPIGMSVAYLRASNADPGDQFGLALAMSTDGTTLAVAAPTEAGGDNVINGNQASNTSPDAGAVYVFVRTGAQWTQQAYVKPTNTDAGDQFGWAVALSADGNTLAVGARHEDGNGISQANNTTSNSGAAYVYTRAGTTWTQQAYLKAPAPNDSDEFGSSLALSGDGNTLIVGAPLADSPGVDAGAAFVFTRTGTTWSVPSELVASNPDAADWFGWQIALSGDGLTAIIAATRESSASASAPTDNSLSQAGAAYVFTRPFSTGTLVKASNPMTGANFGYGVAASRDGSTVAAGAIDESSSARGFNGNQADRSSPSTGAGYVLVGAQHNQQAYAKAPNADAGDSFGWSVALSSDGNVMLMGAPNEQGGAPGVDGNEADDSLASAGAAYIAMRSGQQWIWAHYLKAATPGANDVFGWAVGISGDATIFAVGAPSEDGPSDASLNSGCVYVYY